MDPPSPTPTRPLPVSTGTLRERNANGNGSLIAKAPELRPALTPVRQRITAVVPATNAPATLGRCVASIRAATDPPEEVLVVHTPRDSGPSSARNAGARQATGDLLVFVDSDVLVHRGAFHRIRAAFDADPNLTAIFGSYDGAPEDEAVVSVFRNLLHHHIHQSSPGTARKFWAGLGAIRRDAFLLAGGFDAERFTGSSVEDVDLGMRLNAVGAKIRLDPALQGTHLKAWTLRQMVATDFSRRGTPWVRILLESRTNSKALNLAWRHRVSAAVTLLASGAIGGQRARLAGAAVMTLVALNRSFYRLLAQHGGVRLAVAGVGLHMVHLVTAAASVPAGAALHLLQRKPRAWR
jgi:GT2 family glycosyltransferase